jgi:hypothetical protein
MSSAIVQMAGDLFNRTSRSCCVIDVEDYTASCGSYAPTGGTQLLVCPLHRPSTGEFVWAAHGATSVASVGHLMCESKFALGGGHGKGQIEWRARALVCVRLGEQQKCGQAAELVLAFVLWRR